VHELGYTIARHGLLAGARVGTRRALSRHPVLAAVYLGAVGVAAGLWTLGGLANVVGNYSLPFEGNPVPPGFWRATLEHFDQVLLAVGVLPVVLAASWLVTTFAHPDRRSPHAFAALLAVTVPLLTFQVTSFDLRFTPEQFIQDRYLVYLVPLFAVGCATWLTMRDHLRTRLVSAACVGAFVVVLLRAVPDGNTVIFWAAPGATFRPALASAADGVHLPDVVFLQVAAALAVAAMLLVAWRLPRAALIGAVVFLVTFGAAQLVHAYERYAEPSLVRDDVGRRAWIDAAVPDGEPVALVPGGVDGPVDWWEAELWNGSVERALRIGRTPMPTPFPVLDARIDAERGRVLGPEPSRYVVVSKSETRFGLASARPVAEKASLRLLRVDRPYRLSWTTRNLTRDGWTTPGRDAVVRVFGQGGTGRRAVSLTLAASSRSTRRVPFSVLAPGDSTIGTVDPGGARPPVEVTVCVPEGGWAEVRLVTPRGTRLRDGRLVSLHVERVAVSRAWPCDVF
jgi:hypothetical protein